MSRVHRARLIPAALAAAAVLGITLPLRTLFTPIAWARPTALTILLVLLAGVGLRMVTRIPALIAFGQGVLLLWVTINVQLAATTRWTLPTPDTWQAAVGALMEAHQAVLRSAAPVRLVPGLLLAIVLVVGILAIAVDLLAVTMRMPGAAGLPLLAGFIAVAANSGDGLSPGYFLLPALAWVGLIGHDGLDRLQRWGGAVARPRGGVARDPSAQILNLARVLGVVGIAVALVVPGILPHLPPTFLADGLGRSQTGRGGGTGNLSTLLDVSRNLREQSEDPVLNYTTTVNGPPPLRVDVLTEFDGTQWQASSAPLYDTGGPSPGPDIIRGAVSSTASIPRVTGTSTIRDSRLNRPQAAIPGTPVDLDRTNPGWRVDANGIVRFVEAQPDYTVSFEDLTPAPQAFGRAQDASPFGSDGINDSLAVPMLEKVLDQIAPEGLTPAETAWRIQSYLRSSQFTYALDLAPTVDTDAQGAPLSVDPVSQFLVSRRGYCVQFATAMALLARHRGIPARIAVGFLPGTLEGKTWTVLGKDAHAWPELWFPETGWLRFEPTPGIRTGVAPAWTSAPASTTAPSASASAATPTASEASERADGPTTPTAAGSGQSWVASVGRWLTDNAWVLGLGLALVLAVALVPVSAVLARRRAIHDADGDAERVEVLWESMLSRLADVGLNPDVGDTPRQAGRHLAKAAYLDSRAQEALGGVVATVERARYAATPESDLHRLEEDASTVVRCAQSRKQRSQRLRATLWPREGREALRAVAQAVAGAPQRGLTAYGRRRGERAGPRQSR